MGRRIGLELAGMLALMAFGITGCSRNRSNAQITEELQNRIRGDRRLQLARIQVRSNNGVVTLSGYVESDEQRAATVQDVAQIEGIRTVVDNLRVDNTGPGNPVPGTRTTSSALTGPVPARPAPPKPTPSIIRTASPDRARAISSEHLPPDSQSTTHPAPTQAISAESPTSVSPTSVSSMSSVGVAPGIPASPNPPSTGIQAVTYPDSSPVEMGQAARPEQVTVPYGTELAVRLTESLSSEVNEKGDTFMASLAGPVMVDDRVVIPADAGIEGRVVSVQNAGRFSGKPSLVIELTRLAYNGKTYELTSSQFSKQGASRTTRAAATIGGGAGVGALIGGILGGGRGAAIGAMIGAGAGTGTQATSKAPEVQLPAESMLNFRLQSPLSVEPASTLQAPRGAGSDPQDPFSSDDRPVLKRRPGSPPIDRDTEETGGGSSSDQNPPEKPASPPDSN